MKLRTILINKKMLAVGLAGALSACSTWTPASLNTAEWIAQIQTSPLPAVLLLGEQHDAAEHQQWHQATVQALAVQQRLAALVLEMADHGQDSTHLARTASEDEVRAALQWNDKGWPWKQYGPIVMAAVQAGVPVYGGNLPRTQMRNVMAQDHWDAHLPAPAWERQREAIRTGHCGLLPASQLTPMARIQLAKDSQMASTAAAQMQPGKTVVLIAGRGHVLRSIGIPTWLPANSSRVAVAQAGMLSPAPAADRDWVVQTPAVPAKDHCEKLRAQWSAGAPKLSVPAGDVQPQGAGQPN